MNLLITGVNGLLGRGVAAYLLNNKDIFIFGLSRQQSNFNDVNYKHLNIDLEVDNFEDYLPDSIDIIIHLAQSDDFRNFPEKANNIFNVNVLSTQRLLDFALKSGCKKFIYTSSGGVYGFGNENFSEELNVELSNELGYYLTSKLIGELLVKNYSAFFTTLILRPFFIYGKGQKTNMLIPRLMNNIQNGVPILLQGDSGIKTNPIHVSDAVRAIIKCLELQDSSVYNLAGKETLSLKEICEIIGCEIGKIPIFITNSSSPNHLIGDINKMKINLIEPKINFREGLRDLL
jgi:nucleoside-diphosphate-sugar epimerase